MIKVKILNLKHFSQCYFDCFSAQGERNRKSTWIWKEKGHCGPRSLCCEFMKNLGNYSGIVKGGKILYVQGLPGGLKIKFTWDRIREKNNNQVLLHVHGGPVMKVRPKKWPSQAGLIHYRQRGNKFVRNLQEKENRCLG